MGVLRFPFTGVIGVVNNSLQDLERTYLIRTLQGISHSRGIRMTFMSGGKLFIPPRALPIS